MSPGIWGDLIFSGPRHPEWLQHWPIKKSITHLQNLGGLRLCERTSLPSFRCLLKSHLAYLPYQLSWSQRPPPGRHKKNPHY